ncbi:MAG TPA: GIY-YIG nuclease family protein [Gammaproteobacteria bacterium]|nr:GIY-YIG nuclease family protein [Gammaproteobacteria bacterium]
MDKSYWVYILLCNNGSYYTGYTTDMNRRFDEHLAGTAKCKYTRSFKPIRIARMWKVTNSGLARHLESYIKKLTKSEKEQLILSPELLNTGDRPD